MIITGQIGTELWAGEAVLELKKDYKDLKLAVLTPFLEQESNWNDKNKDYYQSIIGRADLVDSVSKQPYSNPQQFRNKDQFILHKSEGLLLIYDEEKEGSPKYLLQAAKNHQQKRNAYDIHLIDFYELQQLMEEEADRNRPDWT